MSAYLPVMVFVLGWVLAIVGSTPPGADGSAPFDEQALRWMLFLPAGFAVAGGCIAHTFLARKTAEGIGWETNGFQYELGFASLGIGVAAIYASTVDQTSTWVVGAIAAMIFLTLAGINHVVEIVRDRNYAPGNTVILISDFGTPISLLALLLSTGAF